MKSLKVAVVVAMAIIIGVTAVYAMRWPCSGTVTSVVGWRICPFHGREYHDGTDIANGTGTRIGAIGDGRVTLAGSYSGYGNAVIMSHSGGYTSLYGHMSRVTVRRGQHKNPTGKLGYMGSTGFATGPHLHLTVKRYGAVKAPKVRKYAYVRAGAKHLLH